MSVPAPEPAISGAVVPRAEYERIAAERELAKRRAFEAESALRIQSERATEAFALIRSLWVAYRANGATDPHIEERVRDFLDN